MLDGDPAPLPNFRPISIMAKRLDASRRHLVWRWPQPRGLWVRWGSTPSQKGGGGRGQSPQLSAHGYCSRTAEWIKMALGMEVGLGPIHIVLDGDAAPLPKTGGRVPNFRPIFIVAKRLDESGCHLVGAEPPIFGPSLSWPNGWMHQDATWFGGRPRPTRHCVRCGPSYPQKKGTPTPPNFWPMSIVAKWLDRSRRRLVRK